MMRLPDQSRLLLERFSTTDWQNIDLANYSVNHRSAIRRAITRYLSAVLDRKLQMHSYLEELGR
jgi:hypothetical protein